MQYFILMSKYMVVHRELVTQSDTTQYHVVVLEFNFHHRNLDRGLKMRLIQRSLESASCWVKWTFEKGKRNVAMVCNQNIHPGWYPQISRDSLPGDDINPYGSVLKIKMPW